MNGVVRAGDMLTGLHSLTHAGCKQVPPIPRALELTLESWVALFCCVVFPLFVLLTAPLLQLREGRVLLIAMGFVLAYVLMRAYSASLDLGESAQTITPAVVIVDLEVEHGTFQVILESHPNRVRPPPQAIVNAGARQSVLFSLDPSQRQSLIIANGGNGPSRGRIYNVRLMKPPDAAE